MKLIIFFIFFTLTLNADILKENYITIDLNSPKQKIVLDFESDNLEKFITLDENSNSLVSWREIRAKKQEIINFVLPHIEILADGVKCKKDVINFEIYRRIHQSYIKLFIDLSCPKPKDEITIFYDLFFDIDSGQKAFISFKDQNNSQPMILSSLKSKISISLKKASKLQSFLNFLVEGIWHIWIGFDHILFLLMLLIPSVIYYEKKRITPQNSLKKTLINVLKIVTAFSVAHSITLALSVLDIVSVNTKIIEIIIALSVLFTALNNLFGFIKTKIWLIAFGFGLIHGFGFANILNEMLLTSRQVVQSLLGFNLGVEIGQIIIVSLVVPLLFMVRRSLFYKYVVLYGFSIFTAFVAVFWVYERVI